MFIVNMKQMEQYYLKLLVLIYKDGVVKFISLIIDAES